MQASDSGTAPSVPAPTLRARLSRLTPYFGGQRMAWALAIIGTLVGAVTEPLIPALLKPLLDSGFTQGTLDLWLVPMAIIGVFIVRGLAQFMGQYALARIANEGMLRLRKAMFERLLAADMALFSRQSASALSNTVVYEVQTGATQLVQALMGISRDGFTLVALLAYLLYLNWQLTLIVAVVVPSVGWIMKVLSRRLYHITKASQQATDELAYVVEENVLAHRMVRLHGAQDGQAGRFGGLSHSLRRLAIKATIASAAMTPLTQVVAAGACTDCPLRWADRWRSNCSLSRRAAGLAPSVERQYARRPVSSISSRVPTPAWSWWRMARPGAKSHDFHVVSSGIRATSRRLVSTTRPRAKRS